MRAGADWPLDNAQVFETVEAAVAELHLVYAATARPRETVLPVHTPQGRIPQGRIPQEHLPEQARTQAVPRGHRRSVPEPEGLA